MKLTVKVKLVTDDEQRKALLDTVEIFNDACNYISMLAFKKKTFGQVGLHHLCYQDIRKRFGLSAQFTVRAIGKVAESYRAERKKCHVFKKHSAIVYDKRLLSFRGLSLASILTVKGRRKIPIVVGQYAKLEQRRIAGQADLLYVKGKFFLCLVVEVPDGVPVNVRSILGIDLGVKNIATTSEGKVYSGETVEKLRKKATMLKTALQAKGTRSAKRHLKRFSGKERRFKRSVNHAISKEIVQRAKDTACAIALENLSSIRSRTTVRHAQRDRLGKWAFDELRKFIEYKARLAGIPIILVDPRNTSRTCSKCGHVSKDNRKSQAEFCCVQCGFSANADFNAALNIAQKANVNALIVAFFSQNSYKPPALAGGG